MDTDKQKNTYNLFVNASNQANITSARCLDGVQINSVLVFIQPYELEKLEMEELDINISINENGVIQINDTCFEAIEIKPGIKVLGLVKNDF